MQNLHPIPINTLPSPSKPYRVVNRHYIPQKKDWIILVEKVLDNIHRGDLHKIVLARSCILECETEPDPLAITAALQTKAQNATIFCLTDNSTAFLGASPERLFQRTGSFLESDVIAGTRKRGKTIQEDLALETDLFMNNKELREFEVVRKFVQKTLSSFCVSPVSSSKIQVLKTFNAQHLYAKVSGHLIQNVSDTEILATLHPTPALCGFPQRSALTWLKNNEPFERGFYGGVIGWSTPQMSEWLVAIRCCRITGKFVHLLTGAGIVEGSDPNQEWEELDLKTELFHDLFV